MSGMNCSPYQVMVQKPVANGFDVHCYKTKLEAGMQLLWEHLCDSVYSDREPAMALANLRTQLQEHLDDFAKQYRVTFRDTEWLACEQVADVPDVHQVLEAFSQDATGDNGVMVVREVLRAVGADAGKLRAMGKMSADLQAICFGTEQESAHALNRLRCHLDPKAEPTEEADHEA